MSLQTIINQIKEKVQVERFQEALNLCQEALRIDDGGKAVMLHTIRGQCALHIKDNKLAEESLLIVSKDKSLTQLQLQKTWKALSDIYEEQNKWDKHATALENLYQINLIKGNFERTKALADSIAAAYLKLNSLKDDALIEFLCKGCQFLKVHMDTFSSDHSQPLSSSLTLDLVSKVCRINMMIQEAKRNNQSNSISSSSSSLSSYHSQTHDLPMNDDLLFTYVLNAFKTNNKESETVNISEDISHLLVRKLEHMHSDIILGVNGSWDELFSLSSDVIKLDPKFIQDPQILSLLFESYQFSSFSVEYSQEINSYAENLLQIVPDHQWANIIIILKGIRTGFVKKFRSNIHQILSNWKPTMDKLMTKHMSQKSSLLKDFTVEEIASDVMIVSTIIGLCVGVVGSALDSSFRGIPSRDCLYMTQEARRRLLNLELVLKLRGGQSFGPPTVSSTDSHLIKELSYWTALARTTAVTLVSQNTTNLEDAIEVCRFLFEITPDKDSESNTMSGGDLTHVKLNKMFLQNSTLSIQRLSMIVLSALKLYSQAQELASTLLSFNPIYTSWLVMDRVWCQISEHIDGYINKEKKAHPDAVSVILELKRDIILPLTVTAPALDELCRLISSTDPSLSEIEAELRYRIAVIQWLSGGELRSNKTGCLASLMSCVKLEPSHGPVYSFLGHFYSIIMGDKDRAMKCYFKALASDPLDVEAGVCLSQIYLTDQSASSGDSAKKACKLWADVLLLTSHAYWCICLCANYHFLRGEYDDAIKYFQQGLELHPTDVGMLYGLGLSYARLKQGVAAQKSLLLATTYLPSNLYIQCALADTQKKLCLLSEAMLRYEAVLQVKGDFLLALRGVGEVSLAVAYDRLACGWTTGAALSIQKGLIQIEKAIQQVSSSTSPIRDCSSLYKLYGDLCCFVQYLSPYDVSPVSSRPSQGPASLPEYAYEPLLLILSKGRTAFQQALDASAGSEPEFIAERYYDIGLSSYFYGKILLLSKGQGSGLISTDMLYQLRIDDTSCISSTFQEASSAFMKGIRVFAHNSNCWNGLGLSLRELKPQSYECFVRSAQIDSNPAAYANIGLMMIQLREDELSKDCFSALQLMESNPLLWTILGITVERQGVSLLSDDKRHPNLQKAYDAYEAALEVAKPSEALLGSAISWLRLSGLHLSEKDSPISFSLSRSLLTAMRHQVENKLSIYLHRRPVHPLGWALLARVLEIRGAWQRAIHACKSGFFAMNQICTALLEHSSVTNQTNTWIVKLAEDLTRYFGELYSRCARKVRVFEGVPDFESPSDISSHIQNIQKFLDVNTAKTVDLMTIFDFHKSSCYYSNEAIDQAICFYSKSQHQDCVQHLRDTLWERYRDSNIREVSSTLVLITQLYCSLTSEVNSQYRAIIVDFVNLCLLAGRNDNEEDNNKLKLFLRESNMVAICVRALISNGDLKIALDMLQLSLKYDTNSLVLRALHFEIHQRPYVEVVDPVVESASQNLVCKVSDPVAGQVYTTLAQQDSNNNDHHHKEKEYICELDSPTSLFCRVVITHVLRKIQIGRVSDDQDMRLMKRALRLDPYNKRLWGVYASMRFSDETLGHSSPLTSVDNSKDKEILPTSKTDREPNALTEFEKEKEKDTVEICIRILNHMTTSDLNLQSAPVIKYQTTTLMELNSKIDSYSSLNNDLGNEIAARQARILPLPDIASNDHSIDEVVKAFGEWRELGSLLLSQGAINQASCCFDIASKFGKFIECSNEGNNYNKSNHLLEENAKIQVILTHLQKYVMTSKYDDVLQAKDLLDVMESSHPKLAAVHVLRALVWTVLGKTQKAQGTLEEAYNSWKFIHNPFEKLP